MGICCSSTSPELPEQTHMGQSESFKKIIMSSVQTEKSIPPALDLRKRRESNFIDGLLYSELFRAGFVALHRGKDVCNKINVFPIPDGDTGSNMVLTMRDAVKHLDSKETDLVASSRAVALRTTLKAQGNSGTILCYIFSSIAKAVERRGKAKLSVEEFAHCLGDVEMKSAVAKPTEGTILSVTREAFKATKGSRTLSELVKKALDASKASLSRTPDELIVNGKKILKGKGVVDSGAQGFVLILQGMSDALAGTLVYGDYLAQNKTAADPISIDATNTIHHNYEDDDHASLKYRFCTECVAELHKKVSKDMIVSDLDGMGDSVAVQISEMGQDVRIGKIHIHSNDPKQVFECLRSHCKDGVLFKEKSEDMMEQTKLKNYSRAFQPRERVLRSGKRAIRCGVLWTSMNPAPEDFIEQFKEGWVPLHVVVDGKSYKDNRLDISPIRMFNLTRRRDFQKLGTAAWSSDDVKRKLIRLLEKYDEVLSVTLAYELSRGTQNALEKAMKEIEKERPSLRVRERLYQYQHRTVTAGEFAMILRAQWLAHQGLRTLEILARLKTWQESKSTFSVSLISQIDFLRLSGRLQNLDRGVLHYVLNYAQRNGWGVLASSDLSKVDPKAPYLGKLTKKFGKKEKLCRYMPRLVRKMIAKSAGKNTTYDCILGHSAAPHDALQLKTELLGVGIKLRHVYIGSNSAISGTTMGPGFLDTFFWPADDMEFRILTKTEKSMQALLAEETTRTTTQQKETQQSSLPPKLPSILSSKSERFTSSSSPRRRRHRHFNEPSSTSNINHFAETLRESRFKRRAISMRVLDFRKSSGRVSPSTVPVRFGVGSPKSLRVLC